MVTLPPGPLLGIRTALVLLIAIVVGALAGILGHFIEGGLATVVLIGGAAAGALALFHTLIDRG